MGTIINFGRVKQFTGNTYEEYLNYALELPEEDVVKDRTVQYPRFEVDTKDIIKLYEIYEYVKYMRIYREDLIDRLTKPLNTLNFILIDDYKLFSLDAYMRGIDIDIDTNKFKLYIDGTLVYTTEVERSKTNIVEIYKILKTIGIEINTKGVELV